MRTFVALDLDPEIRSRIRAFVDEARAFAPGARWVSAESLHVTLKFIGEKSEDTVKEIERSLASVHAQAIPLQFRGTGFFPNAQAARVFWIGIEADENLAGLARNIEQSLAKIGIAKEERVFNPHLTLARASGGSGAPGWRKGDKANRQFAKLQEFLGKNAPPAFGKMTAHEFFLYCSQLSSKGSQYTKLARFELQPLTS